MNKKIKTVFIKDLFESTDICWELDDVNVLVGKNGSGKSTILQLIKSCVTNDCNYDILNVCEGLQIYFENDEITNQLFSPKIIKTKITETILESEIFKSELKSNILDKEKLDKNLKFNIESALISEKIIEKYLSKQINENPIKLNVEYISTVDMSANSIFNHTRSDGKVVNFLDSEINEELNKLLNSKKSKENKNKLISVLNNMFSDTGKKVKINDNKLSFILKNKKEIELKYLSSGERQIIYIFIKVINASIDDALILMDEPEISLHLSWQEKLISQIREVNKTSQIIIVTHSPAIVMNGWMDSFTDIKNIFIGKDND
ncbi:AAA family ATPase [Acinetobacter geminorum]